MGFRDSISQLVAKSPRWWSGGALVRPNIPTDETLAITEPAGSIPTHIKGRMSGWGEPPNLSTVTVDVAKIQGYIRMAERGDTYNLYAYYRDAVLGNSHVQSEAAKRKMIVVGQPFSLQPYDKENPDDKKACDVIKAMIDCCDNWNEGLMQLSDAQLWPSVATEKIYDFDVEDYEPLKKLGCRLRFKKFAPVNPALLSYRVAYSGAGASLSGSNQTVPRNYIPLPNGNMAGADSDAMIWNPDDWEADLRIYATESNGVINFSPSNFYKPDPARHIVFRESTISSIRDNMGGPMRSLIFWHFLSIQARDWFARSMQRFGSPFTVIYANLQQSDTIQALSQQLNMASQVNGLVLQIGSKVELKETSTTGMAEGYKIFIDLCYDEISKVICGQVSSSGQRKQGGLGGQEKLQSEVRDDLAMYDKNALNQCLRNQLFKDFLRWNGFTGQPPQIIFGGHDDGDLQQWTQAIGTICGAGMKVTDEGIQTINKRMGVEFELAPETLVKNGNTDTTKKSVSTRS